MSDSCKNVQYGLPILYRPEHLQSHLSSFADTNVTHVTDGLTFETLCQSVPLGSGLATPESLCKSAATLSSCAETSHVLLFADGLDRECTVRQLAAQLIPGTRLTVLSCPEHKVQVVQGETSLQHMEMSCFLQPYWTTWACLQLAGALPLLVAIEVCPYSCFQCIHVFLL